MIGEDKSWVIVLGFPNYKVSTDGDVIRVAGKLPIPITPQKSRRDPRTGYSHICMYLNGKAFNKTVHRTVMRSFIGEDIRDVNHKDGNKSNNSLSNLEYVTKKENFDHAKKMGLTCKGSKHYKAYLTDDKVRNMRERYSLGETSIMIAKSLNLPRSTVDGIVSRRRWANVH